MMKKQIRLIALDLDGTTFNTKKIVTERTRQAIMAAIGAGVIVMPATGRPKNTLPESFTSIPGVRYALTSNGGAVIDLVSGEIVHGVFVPQQTACEVIDALLSLDALVEVYHSGICYADRVGYDKVLHTYKNMEQWFKDYVVKSRIPVDNLRDLVYAGGLKIEKFLTSFDDVEERSRAFAKMTEISNISVCNGNEFNMEVSAKTATKGHSLLAFAQKLGIKSEEVMAVGDTGNDESMLKAAGFAVAMGNADPEIKALADYVTLSNDEDGVAHAIEKWVL